MKKQLKSFKDLNVWQKSSDLAALIYSITEKFPKSELYGITNQMRRSAISISSNLAEGFKRQHSKEKIQFYNIAHSSATELESQIEISKKLNFLSESDYRNLSSAVVEVSKMINGLTKSLNPQSSILNSRKGFTAMELLVSMMIFTILMSIAASSFVRALRTQRAVVSLMEANDNTSFALEQMAREMRTGVEFKLYSPEEIEFKNAYGDVARYRLNDNSIERGVQTGGEFDFKKITADNVKISNLNISLMDTDAFGNKYPPRITIGFSVSTFNKYLEGVTTDIQTTVSARNI